MTAELAPAAERLYTVETGSSAQTIAKMLRVLFPDAVSVLDATWGEGKFWDGSADVRVIGLDVSAHGSPSVVGDFTRLPFRDGSVDVVVLDPPYQWDEGRTRRSIMGARFSTYRDERHARETVQGGCQEAWRVARLGVLVKTQDYIHGSLPVRMTRWVEGVMPHEPYAVVHQARASKVTDPKWRDQLSPWSNSTTFLAFRKGSQRHVRRRRAARSEVTYAHASG